MEENVQFTANLPVKVTKKERWFVAACPILDVHSQGVSEEEARKKLGEALSLFFVSCFERGVLDDVLKHCGFKAVHEMPTTGSFVGQPGDYISVPIPFLVNHKSNSECHA